MMNKNVSVDQAAAAHVAQKSLIIFDWDGTLMDSIGLIVESMHVAGEAEGFTTSDQAVKDIIGLSLKRGIAILYPQATDQQRRAIEQHYAQYYIANSHRTPLFEPIDAMLRCLRQRGKTLAVATGKKRQGLDRVLDASNSRHYFAVTRGADESGSKPDPQMLIDIMAQTPYGVGDAVFIGDSVHDIEMANALGMMSIAVSYGAASPSLLATHAPTYQVTTPQALAQLLCAQAEDSL